MTSMRDGIDPSILRSTVKQFLCGMIPDRKSSHLTEAIASGCGYASNAAYLSDLDERTVLVAAGALSSERMSARLSHLSGTDAAEDATIVEKALLSLSRTMPGNVVPIGPRSALLSSSAPKSLLDSKDLAIWRSIAEKRQGLCIVCGPFGAGKTVLLNDTIMHLTLSGRRVHVVEAREGDTSTHAFAADMRSFMRQDPDVIVIDDITTRDMLNAAIRAAQTGHMVLASLRTPSVDDAMRSLVSLGASAMDLERVLQTIMALATLRSSCRSCGGTASCLDCRHAGSSGLLMFSDLVQFASAEDVHSMLVSVLSSRRGGPEKLLDRSLDKVKSGVLSIAEIERVFGKRGLDRAAERGVKALPSRTGQG